MLEAHESWMCDTAKIGRMCLQGTRRMSYEPRGTEEKTGARARVS